MFVRFVVGADDENPAWLTGIITKARILRDEGELYGRRLREAGVDATVSRYEGAGHGFVQHFSWIPEYHQVFAETRDFLNRR